MVLSQKVQILTRASGGLITHRGGSAGHAALATVLERSRLLCLQRYEKDLRLPDSYMAAYLRLGCQLLPQQLAGFAGVLLCLAAFAPGST